MKIWELEIAQVMYMSKDVVPSWQILWNVKLNESDEWE